MGIFFLKGLIIGFSIAAPVGPIAVLCVRRTLMDGRVSGFVSGLGAATADGIYGCIAGFGVTIVSSFLISQEVWFRLIGGLFLCFLGLKAFGVRPLEQADEAKSMSILGAYLSTLFLTLTNPMTILSFAAVFAGLGLGISGGDYCSAAILVLGVFLGSALWWLALSCGVGLFRTRLTLQGLRWVSRGSGVIITGFGLSAIVSCL
jgi:threonine/homoserine/homoserine lactone efflux protein